jgi:hypothetical protein
MNPENHVTSLEISKKLFELGIPQQSVWGLHWVLSEWGSDAEGNTYTNRMTLTHDVIGSHSDCKYKAFLASEIMEMLTDRIIKLDGEPFNCFRFHMYRSFVIEDGKTMTPTFIINYICDTFEAEGKNAFMEKRFFEHNIWDKTLPDALGKTLIYMIENKIPPIVYPRIISECEND